MYYYDDICFLEKFMKENYQTTYYSKEYDADYFRKKNIQHWAAYFAIALCYDRTDTDPLDIIEDLSNNYQVDSIFSIQQINKLINQYSYEAIDNMREMLLKRRGVNTNEY